MEAQELLIEGVDHPLGIRHTQFSLIAVWNTYKTGPLVHDQADDACREEKRNHNDDDQMEGMRKQSASGPQGADDRPTGNHPCRYWEQDETDGHEHTGEISHFRVRAIEQPIQRQPTNSFQQSEYAGGQEKDNANDRSRLGDCEESISLCKSGICHVMIARPPGSHDRKQDEADGKQIEPQAEKQKEGEIFIEISPLDDFHGHERKDEEKTNKRR